MAPQSPDPGGPSYTSRKSSNQNNGGPPCRKGFEKSPAPQGSCCLLPPESLRRWTTAPSASPAGRSLGLLESEERYLGKIRTHEPWPPSSDTLHWKLPPGTPLPLGLLICTSQPSWARGSAAALWTLPGTTSARTARSRASLRGCKDASQKAISLCRSATKNSKEGGCRDNQFPEVNINLTHTVFFFLLLGFLKSTFFHKKT